MWDENSEIARRDVLFDSKGSMFLLHEWSDGLAAGRGHDVSFLSGLILAACKGQAVCSILSLPMNSHIDS